MYKKRINIFIGVLGSFFVAKESESIYFGTVLRADEASKCKIGIECQCDAA